MTKLLTLITTTLLAAVLMTATLALGAEPAPPEPAPGAVPAPEKVVKMRGTTQAQRKAAADRNRIRLETEAKKQTPEASPNTPSSQ